MASHLRQILNCSPLVAILGGKGSSNLSRSIRLSSKSKEESRKCRYIETKRRNRGSLHCLIAGSGEVRVKTKMSFGMRRITLVVLCLLPCLAANPLSGVIRAYANVLASNPTATHLVQGAAVTGLGDAASQWIEGCRLPLQPPYVQQDGSHVQEQSGESHLLTTLL
jgi:hypothetical protein